jgi:plasmid maintenance system antidote protein VapI
MKLYKELEKKYSSKEIAGSFVFPGTIKEKGKLEKIEAFQQYRKTFESRQTEKDKLVSKLLQLRFQMEDYIKNDTFTKTHDFSYFLKEYILRLQKKSKEFANEIDVDPTELSQIINQHRQPTEKLIIRLEIHSNKNFPALLWFKLIEKEKAYELVHNKDLRERERRHVKQKLEFSIL